MPLSPQAQAIIDNLFLTEYKKPFSEEAPFAALVEAMGEAQKHAWQMPPFVGEAVSVHETRLAEEARVFSLSPKDPAQASDKQVLYFHGGAFLLNIMDTQCALAVHLVEMTGCTVHLLEYPLAPTCTHKETYRAMMDSYRWALARCAPENLVLLGDSVGAHMVIAAAQLALQQGLPQPTQIVALSPWIDFGNFLPGKAELESGDPVIGMVSLLGIPRVWCGPVMHDKACPPNLQYGPFEGMAPVYIQVGSTEVLSIDALELQRLIEQAGGSVELEVGEGLWHTYALYDTMPEGMEAVERIAQHIQGA